MSERSWLRVGGGAAALFASLLAFKIAMFLTGVMITRFGGAAALGVFSVGHTVLGITLPLAGLGIATLTLYHAAQQVKTPRLGARHALYLTTTTLGFALVAASIGKIGGVRSLSMVAVLWLVPALGQTWAAFVFSHARGLAQPCREVITGFVAAVVLAGSALLARSQLELGIGCAAATLVFCGGIAHAVADLRSLTPRLPQWGEIKATLSSSSGYFVLDALLFALSTLDLLVVHFAIGAESTGVLNAATVLPRNAAFVPLFASLLMLRSSGHADFYRVGARVLVGVTLGFYALMAPLAWILLPMLSRAYALPLSALEPTALAALATAPALFLMVALVPLAVARNMRGTLGGLVLGVAVAGFGAAWLTPLYGAVGALAATGVGQLIAALRAAWTLSGKR